MSLQVVCLPLFCASKRLLINERCVSLITKVIARSVGLVLETDIKAKLIARPEFISVTHAKDPYMMLRSTCLGFKWTYIALLAQCDIHSNGTDMLRLVLIKTYEQDKNLLFSRILSRMKACTLSTWEVHLNGQWIEVRFNFPEVPPYNREQPITRMLTKSPVRIDFRKELPYYITKLDFCQQVSKQRVNAQ